MLRVLTVWQSEVVLLNGDFVCFMVIFLKMLCSYVVCISRCLRAETSYFFIKTKSVEKKLKQSMVCSILYIVIDQKLGHIKRGVCGEVSIISK